MTHFIRDNTSIPGPKVEWDGASSPIARPDMYVSSSDYNTTRQACLDIQSWLRGNLLAVDVTTRGVKCDGATSAAANTTALQALINDNTVHALFFPAANPSAGDLGYGTNATLIINRRSFSLIGGFGTRAAAGGSHIIYYGTGACIQYGTDNGHAWDVNDYDGPQDQLIDKLWISSANGVLGNLASNPGGAGYAPGCWGVWDYRCGGITLKDSGVEMFEANFVGIQSDISAWFSVYSNYSKYGIYLGPRSDQNRIFNLWTIFCDRAVTIDRAGQAGLYGCVFAFTGTDTSSPVEVRRGSHGVLIKDCWFENSGVGFVSGDMQAMVSVGEVNGYGAGGSVSSPGGTPTTVSVAGCVIDCPHLYPLPSGFGGHTKYIAAVGKCQQFRLDQPTVYILSGLSAFDALVAIRSGQTPTTTDTQITITGFIEGLTPAQCFANLGGGWAGGLPYLRAGRNMHSVVLGLDATAVHTVRGAISHAAPPGANAFQTTNSNTGQTSAAALWKLLHAGSHDTTSGVQNTIGLQIQMNATRSAGANSLAQTALNLTSSGAQTNNALTTDAGNVFLNQTSGLTAFLKGVFLHNQIFPTAMTVDVTDLTFTSIADGAFFGLSSTANVLVNSMVMDANTAFGRLAIVRNVNAGGTSNITLVHESGLGTASRRFSCSGYANIVLAPGEFALLYYLGALGRIGAMKF